MLFLIGNYRQQALFKTQWDVWGSAIPWAEREGKEFFGVPRGNGGEAAKIGPRWVE